MICVACKEVAVVTLHLHATLVHYKPRIMAYAEYCTYIIMLPRCMNVMLLMCKHLLSNAKDVNQEQHKVSKYCMVRWSAKGGLVLAVGNT